MFENWSTHPLSFALNNNIMEDNNMRTGDDVREQVEDEVDGYYIPHLPLSPPAPSPEYENVPHSVRDSSVTRIL